VASNTAVIAGFGGDLISHAFVEDELLPAAPAGAQLGAFERQAFGWWKRVQRQLGPASSARSVHDIAVAPLLHLLGHERPAMSPHPRGCCGSLHLSNTVVMTLPWMAPVRSAWRDAAVAGIAAGAEWAMVANGHSLALIDCTRPWTRHSIEFDVERIMSNPQALAVLWLLCRAGSIAGTGERTLRDAIQGSDAYASRLCNTLGDGVLHVLPRLASAFAAPGRRPQRTETLDQALTVVYRVLFLLFAEARGLVPVWHELYRDAYSIDILARDAAVGRIRGVWPALQAISRLAHAGCKAGDLEVTAFNGRLFSPRHAPVADRRRIPDPIAAEVLLSLATTSTPSGRRRISYHDLGVEQLGSVYERVLEYEPVAEDGAIELSRTSIERKTTGSFYTPRSITEYLVRRALAPLVENRRADQILRLRILDPAMGSGAFLVAACRYLADQCERALVDEGRWSAGDVHAADRSALRRQIAEQCLFGVDLNPSAVQLARLSLWLTTLAAERPLTFLDHHLVAGNSLLGARLADLARPPRVGRHRSHDAPLPLFADQVAEIVAHRVLPARLRIAMTPSDSVDDVRDKETLLAGLAAPGGPIARWAAAADAWCAALLWPPPRPAPGVVAEWIAFATGAPTTLPRSELHASLDRVRAVAARHGAFHWELAFPEIFFDAGGRLRSDGGFDAIIGNPPWDMLRADIGSQHDRATAKAGTGAELRFFRDSGIYELQGQGHANRYQLFLERALQLTTPRGRIGLILPSGIGTDRGSATLRRHLFDRTTIDTWLGFDNRQRIFPIHRSMRFVLLSAELAGRTDVLTFRCALSDPATLDGQTGESALRIARSRLEAWSPELAIPEVADETALGILSGISSRFPALGDTGGWNLRFGRELNATEDRPHFVPLRDVRPRLLPVIEGKLLSPFQVDVDRAAAGIPVGVASRLLDRESFQRPRLAYRDVASATNKLTLIAAMLPAGSVSTHTVFVLKTRLDEESQWCLLGLMNSLVTNYLVRLRVMTHVTATMLSRLPVPRPVAGSPPFETLALLSRQLSVTGIDEGADEYARLNAIVARLYGLTHDQFEYVLATFPLIATRLRERCLNAFYIGSL
jgi:methylase of polypeptide subunit release factors